jgi:hypothetical protein
MLRRITALLLVASSAWLFHQTTHDLFDPSRGAFVEQLTQAVGEWRVLVPAIGGVLGLFGGLLVLFGGVGGAFMALVGGALAAGFALYIGKSVWTGRLDIWNNEAAVGLVMLILAGLAAVMGRD